jgi:hypothetical protein
VEVLLVKRGGEVVESAVMVSIVLAFWWQVLVRELKWIEERLLRVWIESVEGKRER